MTTDQEHAEKPTDLVSAVVQLSADVVHLTSRLTISDQIAQRSRRLVASVVVIVAIVLIGGTINQFRIAHVVSGNTANAIQSCQNANETRAANLALWTTVLDYVRGDKPVKADDPLERLQTWITLLYAPHDCSDLSRVYKIPPPPELDTP